jgi:hypothetical protein
MPHSRVISVALLTGLLYCNASAQESALFRDGMSVPVVTLFPAETLDAFTIYSKQRNAYTDPNRVFRLKDGFLRASGDEVLFLKTKRTFKNYYLVAEYKWLDSVTPRDSGLMVNTIGKGRGQTALECNIMDSSSKAPAFILWGPGTRQITVDGKKLVKGRIQKPEGGDVEKPLGQWNRIEVICDRGRFLFSINGRLIVSGMNPLPSSGAIMFQHNKGAIEFGRVRLVDYDSLSQRDAQTARQWQQALFDR